MAAVQQAMPQQGGQQQQQGGGPPGGGNAAMARMLPPGMSKEKVQEIYRVGGSLDLIRYAYMGRNDANAHVYDAEIPSDEGSRHARDRPRDD